MAKKKTKTNKKTSASRTTSKTKQSKKKSASKTTRKKTASKPASSVKKTTTKKKTSSKKKTTKKKTSKKAAASKPAASSPKKKTSTKSAGQTSKKAPVKKKKTSQKAAAETKTKSAASSKKTTAKETKKKTTTSSRSKANTRGHSVAEAAALAEADSQGYVFIKGRRVRMLSSKAPATVKKTVKPKVVEEVAVQEPVKPKAIKTPLSRKELNHYRKLLLEKRAEIIGDLGSIEQEALRNSGSTHMPIHMADVGSDTYEQDFMLGLAEAERKQLRDIDDALVRIQDHTYGVCLMTGKPIPTARLDAKPWAKYTIEAARQIESGQTV